MTPEEVAKVRQLLTHEDPDIQRQGLELAKSFGDYSAVFEGCSIDDEGKIQLSFGSLNSIMLEGFLQSGVVDPLSISSLDLSNCRSLENVDGLTGLTNLTSLDLSDCPSLENVDGLARLTNLNWLAISDCDTLKNIDGLAGLTNLNSLYLRRCPQLQNIGALAGLLNLTTLYLNDNYRFDNDNIDVLADLRKLESLDLSYWELLRSVHQLAELTNLTSLNLSDCRSLENIDALAGLKNLTSLNLIDCESLRIAPDEPDMTTRGEVAAYQAQLRNKMISFDLWWLDGFQSGSRNDGYSSTLFGAGLELHQLHHWQSDQVTTTLDKLNDQLNEVTRAAEIKPLDNINKVTGTKAAGILIRHFCAQVEAIGRFLALEDYRLIVRAGVDSNLSDPWWLNIRGTIFDPLNDESKLHKVVAENRCNEMDAIFTVIGRTSLDIYELDARMLNISNLLGEITAGITLDIGVVQTYFAGDYESGNLQGLASNGLDSHDFGLHSLSNSHQNRRIVKLLEEHAKIIPNYQTFASLYPEWFTGTLDQQFSTICSSLIAQLETYILNENDL